ncbi:DUF1648 domain-containing protein [Staphylococcus chromogenes]|uniref:DUF1648 domain-containing protein n=1 Tax=Staphylococcus chromogenes TaxID=46126 RepID=UPI0028FEE746|nr:DUF1648 domain-containing protein [Staphylococcus chromogenes]MDU0476205.1 DUF1648 domain-containing protein [Staphylococcus chromogenes]
MNRQHKYLRFIYTLILVMWLGALIYLGVSYTQLPHTVATHFSLFGEADTFGPKSNYGSYPFSFYFYGA